MYKRSIQKKKKTVPLAEKYSYIYSKTWQPLSSSLLELIKGLSRWFFFFLNGKCSHPNGNFYESRDVSTSVLLGSALRFKTDFLVRHRGTMTILVFRHWQTNKHTHKKSRKTQSQHSIIYRISRFKSLASLLYVWT